VIYKDDLNWLKGVGCFVWDTPEILHAKHAYDLRSDVSGYAGFAALVFSLHCILKGWRSFILLQIQSGKCYIYFSTEVFIKYP